VPTQEYDYLMTIPEVAETCRCGPETIRRWIRTGKLAAVPMPGGLYRVWASQLEKVLKAPVVDE
jgi:excisionase family DNA binding protein